MFIVLSSNIVKGYNHIKRISLSNQCMIQPTVINLHPNEYSQEFHCYSFAVKLDKYVGSCNTLNKLSNKVCVPSKTEEVNLRVLNMIVKNIMYVIKIIIGILLHSVAEMENIWQVLWMI